MEKILITGARSKLTQPVIKHFCELNADITSVSKNKLDHERKS